MRINWLNFARLNSNNKSGQSQKYLGRQRLPLPLIKSAYGASSPAPSSVYDSVDILLQLTGDLMWANDKVPLMQQNCVDDILNRDYTELNDTAGVISETVKIIEAEVSLVMCQPFDCNGNGRCVNGTCICDPSWFIHLFVQRHRHSGQSSSSSIAVLQLKGWRHVWPFSKCPCLQQILLHRWSTVPSSHWCLPSIVSLVAPYLCSLERSPVWCFSLSNLLSSLYVHCSSASLFLCELTVTSPLLASIVPIRLFCDLSTKLSILSTVGSTKLLWLRLHRMLNNFSHERYTNNRTVVWELHRVSMHPLLIVHFPQPASTVPEIWRESHNYKSRSGHVTYSRLSLT